MLFFFCVLEFPMRLIASASTTFFSKRASENSMKQPLHQLARLW
jgi:hypothetical protein